jgi:hypothetical protein
MEATEDHSYGRSTSMWNLTSYDLHRIKGQVQPRRARTDAKYAEECKALDAEFAELETLERVAAAAALKYRPDDTADPSEDNSSKAGEDNTPTESEVVAETQPLMAAVDGGNGTDPKTASRWRLALPDRPAE